MPKAYEISKELTNQLFEKMRETKCLGTYRRLQAVALRGKGRKNAEAAEVTGFNQKYVTVLVRKCVTQGIDSIMQDNRTGGANQNLSYEQEIEFLQQFLEKAQKGQVVNVGEIARAYDKLTGKERKSLSTIYQLAYIYDRLGDFESALIWHGKAIEIKERTLGKEHPSTAISYSNIAGIYFDKGDYKKSEKYYRMALAIREKKLGGDHPDTATIYHALACIYEKQGKNNEALSLFIKAYSIRRHKLGIEHKVAIDSFGCIKTIYDKIAPVSISFEDWLKEIIRKTGAGSGVDKQ